MTGGLARRFDEFVQRMEQLPIGPGHLALALGGIIALRTFLEIVVAQNPVFPGLAAFIHYPLAYVAPFLGLTLVLAAWSRVAPARVARLMLLAWLLTLAPPVLDLFIHRGSRPPAIGYSQADPADLGWTWLHFFDPSVAMAGTTAGIRLEIAAAVLLGAVYVLLRSRRTGRAIVAVPTIYAASLFFLTLPLIVVRLFRLVAPEVTLREVFWGEGLLNRPAGRDLPDSAAIVWLVALIAALALVWRWLERRAEAREAWLRGAGSTVAFPGLIAGLAAAQVAGCVAALGLHFQVDQPLVTAPYDYLGLFAGPLTIVLLATAALGRQGAGHVRAGLALLGLALVAALGTAVGVAALACAGPLLFVAAPWLPPRADRPVRVAATAVAALGAFGAGYALLMGPEALARVPDAFWILCLLWGAALAFACAGIVPARLWLPGVVLALSLGAGTLLLGPPALAGIAAVVGLGTGLAAAWIDNLFPEWRRGVAGAGAGLSFLLSVASVVMSQASREPLVAQVRCVPSLHVARAQEYLEKKEWLNARTEYNLALKCDPVNPHALSGLGLGLLQNEPDKRDRALELLEQAVKQSPDSPADLSNLASAYTLAGRPADALPLLDRALDIDGRHPEALFNRARALEDLGRTAEAIAAWERFQARVSQFPDRVNDLGLAQQRLRILRGQPPAPRQRKLQSPGPGNEER